MFKKFLLSALLSFSCLLSATTEVNKTYDYLSKEIYNDDFKRFKTTLLEALKSKNNKPFKINSKDEKGRTILHLTARLKDVRFANLLIRHGANVNTKNYLGRTPLFYVRHAETAKFLIKKGATVDVKENRRENTPLHLASKYARPPEIAMALLNHGAKVNAKNKLGSTPLHIATKSGNAKVVKLLLDRGANIKIKDKYGKIPYKYSRRSSQVNSLKGSSFSEIKKMLEVHTNKIKRKNHNKKN